MPQWGAGLCQLSAGGPLRLVSGDDYPVRVSTKGYLGAGTEVITGRLERTLHKNTDTPFTADMNAIRDRTYAAWLVNETYSYLYSSYLYIRLNQ